MLRDNAQMLWYESPRRRIAFVATNQSPTNELEGVVKRGGAMKKLLLGSAALIGLAAANPANVTALAASCLRVSTLVVIDSQFRRFIGRVRCGTGLRQPVSNFPFQTVRAVFRHTA